MAVPTIRCRGPDANGFMWAGAVFSSRGIYPNTLNVIQDKIVRQLADSEEYECKRVGDGLIQFSIRIKPENRGSTIRKITILHSVLSEALMQGIVIEAAVFHIP